MSRVTCHKSHNFLYDIHFPGQFRWSEGAKGGCEGTEHHQQPGGPQRQVSSRETVTSLISDEVKKKVSGIVRIFVVGIRRQT